MTPRTPTLPPSEPAMWRKLLAAAHPDSCGSHDLFIWAQAVREAVCEGGFAGHASSPSPRSSSGRSASSSGSSDAVPFDEDLDHLTLVRSALALATEVGEPYASLLRLLKGCDVAYFGPEHTQQQRGATYKQLAAIGHGIGMTKAERVRWYRIAEDIPLSRRHAGHVLSRLKKAAA